MKIWTSEEKGNEKIIAYIDQTIYKGNPKPEDIANCVYDLKIKKIPTDNFVGIPLHYLKQINLQDGKKYIEILFGKDSREHLRIIDDKIKYEIFDFFKANIPRISYSIDRFSKLRAAKKPLIAMCVVVVLFCWTFYIANGVEQGNQYDVSNGRYDSFAGLVLILASLGVKNVVLIFLSLFAIALIAIIRKIKNPPVISRLTIQR